MPVLPVRVGRVAEAVTSPYGPVRRAVMNTLGAGHNYRPYPSSTLDALPRTGLTVASTFSGIGGSSMGYRAAGWTVTYAAEFIAAAADAYVANGSPGTHLDRADVRDLTGGDLVDRAGSVPDLLDGSPPCAAFSTLGKRAERWGQEVKYSSTTQQVDDLVYEFMRLVGEVRPRAFVLENVVGLTIGVARGYFLRLLALADDLGYRTSSTIVTADRVGTPSIRRRLIVVGYRDLSAADPIAPDPGPPTPWSTVTPYTWWESARPASPNPARRIRRVPTRRGIPTVAVGNLGDVPRSYVATADDPGRVCPYTGETIGPPTAGSGLRDRLGPDARQIGLVDVVPASGFPIDVRLPGTHTAGWERIGRAVPPTMMARVAADVADRLLQ